MPTISVIMGCYNGEKYLDNAIKSILEQSYNNFEFIIFDDASTDRSRKIIRKWANIDKRIHLYYNKQNLGLAATLNHALLVTRGQYIARMDADDISVPERLKRQLDFLKNGDSDICGTWTRSMGHLKSRVTRYPVTHEEIQAYLYFQTAFSHPSVMASSQVYKKFRYEENAGIAEDYDLWARMACQGVKMANIPEVLLLYRKHQNQVSENSCLIQAKHATNVREMYAQNTGIQLNQENITTAGLMRPVMPPDNREQVIAAEKWLLKMAEHYSDQPLAQRVVASEWYIYSLRASTFGTWTWGRYCSSPLYQLWPPGWKQLTELFIACAIRLKYRSKLYNFMEIFSLT